MSDSSSKTPAASVDTSESASALIDRLKESKSYWDKALKQALDQTNELGKPISEEKAKLITREAVRKLHEEPELIRWRLFALLNPPMAMWRELNDEHRA